MYRRINSQLQIFLVHPGGPFYKNKDDGSWSIPKGEYLDDEEPLNAAKREFLEETGHAVDGDFVVLGSVQLKSGKIVHAWAVEGDIDHETIFSNMFEMEWPLKSGKIKSFPEVDSAAWFEPETAKQKVNPAQAPLIERLQKIISDKVTQ